MSQIDRLRLEARKHALALVIDNFPGARTPEKNIEIAKEFEAYLTEHLDEKTDIRVALLETKLTRVRELYRQRREAIIEGFTEDEDLFLAALGNTIEEDDLK